MTISYQLAPIPKWYIADLTGLPLGAGYLGVYDNLNPTIKKLVYSDADGNLPWPTSQIPNQPLGTVGILFDENGSQGPFYWEADSDDATDLYFLAAYDLNGVFQWSIPNYGPPAGEGGGGNSTQNGFQNLIVNSVMNKNFGSSNNPIGTTEVKLAPSAHSGLAQTASNFGPDIWFYKSNTTATDQISFVDFALGSNELTPDVTPAQFLRYSCTAAGTSETFKYTQIPITQNVQNLSGKTITVSIWARRFSGTGTLSLNAPQFFGDGGDGSATAANPIGTFSVTTSWKQIIFTTTLPSVSGKTQGSCQNDGLFLQINYPLDQTVVMDIIKPCIYAGTVSPNDQLQYTPYDMTESVTNSDRTGRIIQNYDLEAPFGYRALDDTTISKSGSTENISLFPLYNYLWNNVSSPSGNTLCPVSTGLGANAAADFVADKTLTLQPFLGRALTSAGAGAGLTARDLGSNVGTESTTEVPNHVHHFVSDNLFAQNSSDPGVGASATPGYIPAGVEGTTANPTGGVTSVSLMQPSSFVNFYIKL